jgi:hypothetical protein
MREKGPFSGRSITVVNDLSIDDSSTSTPRPRNSRRPWPPAPTFAFQDSVCRLRHLPHVPGGLYPYQRSFRTRPFHRARMNDFNAQVLASTRTNP